MDTPAVATLLDGSTVSGRLTTSHSASSYGKPVFVTDDGEALDAWQVARIATRTTETADMEPDLSDATALDLLNPWTHVHARTMTWGEIKAWCETRVYPADRPLWLEEARKAALANDGATLGAMIIGA